MISRERIAVLFTVAMVVCVSTVANAFPDDEIHIAVLSDFGGPFSDVGGISSATAAQLAVDDSRQLLDGLAVEISVIDHRNDGDYARQALQDLHQQKSVHAIADLRGTNVVEPLTALAAELGIVALSAGGISEAGRDEACAPHTAFWGGDTYSRGALISRQIARNAWHGWTIMVPESRLGTRFAEDLRTRIEISGGFVQAVVTHGGSHAELETDFAAILASDTEAVAIAAGGERLGNVIRSAYEIGVFSADKGIAIVNMTIADVRDLGLYFAAGLEFTAAFYWNANDESRAFSERFLKIAGVVPTETHAAVYSSVRHFLAAAAQVREADPDALFQAMRREPVDDFIGQGGEIREDGRLMHPMYWLRVKPASESERAWDYLQIVEQIPPAAAFPPMTGDGCS